MRRYLLIGALIGAGCTQATGDEPTPSSAPITETRAQSLGESTQAYWFEGNGANPMPSLAERQAWQLINQIRMNTDVYDIRDMDDNLIPPAPPLTLQPGMIEVGRWQGQHALNYACYCSPDMNGVPTPAPAGNSPFSCCTLGYVNGTIRCVGPVVSCGDDGMTDSVDRWGTLNRGPGEVQSEIYWATEDEAAATGVGGGGWFLQNALGAALSARSTTGAAAQVQIGLVPDECLPPEDTCESGDCVGPGGETSCDPADEGAPNECIGMCNRGPKAGEFCTIPEPLDPVACDPENYPQGYWWSFMFGQTSEPTPFLADVIHSNLQEGTVSVAVNYYDPVGEPQLLQIATDSACNDLERTFMRPGEGMGGADMGGDAGVDMSTYAGNTYHWNVAQTGCIRYIAYAVDSEGFTQTYPTYGSLGMNLAAGGEILPNDASCPIWSPDERPNPSCLPNADECAEGSTRICYTGRPGTEDKGICDVGTETCRNGRWAGLCDGETRPEPTDTCGDGEDDNCNGFADEDCPVLVDQSPDMGGSGGDADAGNNANNGNGGNNSNGGNNGTGESNNGTGGGGGGGDGGCCATADGSRPEGTLPLFVGLLGWLVIRRRR